MPVTRLAFTDFRSYASALIAPGPGFVLLSGDKTRTAVRVRSYSDLRSGQIGLVTDSYGLVSIALDRRSAAEELRMGSGDSVTIKPAE